MGAVGNWCPLSTLPASPSTVVQYLMALGKRHKASTVVRHLSSISVRHRALKQSNPAEDAQVREILRGIQRHKREQGESARQAKPLDRELMLRVLSFIAPDTNMGRRDAALLLCGYAAALREDSLVSLDLEDLRVKAKHIDLVLRREKTSQTGQPRSVPIVPAPPESPVCPIRALKSWVAGAGLKSGPLFRRMTRGDRVTSDRLGPEAVAAIVRARVRAAGIADPGAYSGHSLRSGHITEALRGGASPHETMRVTGHRRIDTLLRYSREADPVRGTSAQAIWGKKS